MTDWLLAIAVVAAIAGMLARNVTAAALLASFVLSSTLCRLAVPFDIILWLAMDVTVIFVIAAVSIVHWQFRVSDAAIIALFLPVWAIYVFIPPWASKAVDTIIAVQFLLTYPLGLLTLLRHWVLAAREDFEKRPRTGGEFSWA